MNLNEEIIKKVEARGFPAAFGQMVAQQLATEKAMKRMLSYLSHADKVTMEDIADEMLAICSDRDNWVKKKKAEYYNACYNSTLFQKKVKK